MIGVDIVDKRRIAALWLKNGERFAQKILHPAELERLTKLKNPARFLAMRWAAKEAFAKALQTGLRPPILMPAIAVKNAPSGAPIFEFSPEIAALLAAQEIVAVHLSLSDEKEYAIAMVAVEKGHIASPQP